MIKALQDPILDDGISFTSYFNGRLLSSEDLARDQRGNRDARRRSHLSLSQPLRCKDCQAGGCQPVAFRDHALAHAEMAAQQPHILPALHRLLAHDLGASI